MHLLARHVGRGRPSNRYSCSFLFLLSSDRAIYTYSLLCAYFAGTKENMEKLDEDFIAGEFNPEDPLLPVPSDNDNCPSSAPQEKGTCIHIAFCV